MSNDIAWSDDRTYRWTLHAPKHSLVHNVTYLFGVLLAAPIFGFGACIFLQVIWPPLATWFGVLATLFLSFSVVVCLYQQAKKSNAPRDRIQSGWNSAAASIVVVWILFFLLWQKRLFNDAFSSTETAGFWSWMGYLLERTSEIVLLDVPKNVLGLKFTAISPTDWLGKSIQFFLKLMITAGFVQIVVQVWKMRYAAKSDFIGTLEELYWHCDLIPSKDSVEIQAVGRFEPLPFEWYATAQQVVEKYNGDATNTAKSSKA